MRRPPEMKPSGGASSHWRCPQIIEGLFDDNHVHTAVLGTARSRRVRGDGLALAEAHLLEAVRIDALGLKILNTALALFFPNAWLYASVPTLSVLPWSSSTTSGLSCMIFTARSNSTLASGFRFDLLKSKFTEWKLMGSLAAGGGGGGGGVGAGGGGGGEEVAVEAVDKIRPVLPDPWPGREGP